MDERRAAVNARRLRAYARRLRDEGWIVLPPSTRKVRKFGPLKITTDPVGFRIGWRR